MSSANELVVDVHRLVEASSLLSVEVFKLSAERQLDVEPTDDFEIDPSYLLTTDFRDDGAGFRIRLLTDIETPIGTISCGVLAEYAHDGVRLGPESSEALNEFVNGVALMHIIPYVRQAIADVTLRVYQSPLLMPILQRGQMTFDVSIDSTSR